MKLAVAIVAAALAPGTARADMPSKQDIFCAQLKRIVEVAELGGDFAALERSRAAPPRLGFAHCQATGDLSKQYWLCSQSLAPEELSRDNLAARVAKCLPEAVNEANGLLRDAEFTLPYVRIHIDELGGPGAHVGRIVELVVEAIRPPPDPAGIK